MKKIIYSFLIGTAVLVACDPIESREPMGGAITAEQLNVTVTPVEVDGVKSNKLILENHSPVLSRWDYGMGISSKAYDEVLVTSVGDMVVTFIGLNPDGTKITKEIPVTVESIVFEVVGMDKFIGSGSKTWVWDEFTNERSFGGVDAVYPYGISGAGDKTPGWWGLAYGDFSESDATMTFSLDGGAIFVKTLGDGTQQKGTFSFNMTKKVDKWSQGILSLKGATIPHPVSMNSPAGDAYEFYILELEDDQLVLANVSGNGVPDRPDDGGEVNIWMFRPQGYTAADNSEQMAAITGGSEKVWTWKNDSDASIWGNGGYRGNTAPAWWGRTIKDIDQQTTTDGVGATMKFSADGTLVKTKVDGSTETGTFAIDMGKPTMTGDDSKVWAMGKLKTKETTLLLGLSPNEGNAPVYAYDILSLTDNAMTVAYAKDGEGPGGEAWYWFFETK